MKLTGLEHYTLSKLIHFVKFNCQDYQARYFAGSPIIGEILKKVINELDAKKMSTDYFNLEVESHVFNLIFNWIKSDEKYNEIVITKNVNSIIPKKIRNKIME